VPAGWTWLYTNAGQAGLSKPDRRRQMGLLAGIGGIATLLFGPAAGLCVDYLPRRPILIATDLGRAIVLGINPTCRNVRNVENATDLPGRGSGGNSNCAVRCCVSRSYLPPQVEHVSSPGWQ
jgi:hypothetical protein